MTLQQGDFKDYVVPTWRISDKEPTDLKTGCHYCRRQVEAQRLMRAIKKPPPKQRHCKRCGHWCQR